MEHLHTYTLDECWNYSVFGRTTVNRSPLTLFWGGSGIELNVKAKELWVSFETDYHDYEQWISIYINQAFISRQMLVKGKQDICIFRHMNPEVTKEVRILKEVQAMPSDCAHCLQIHSLATDGDFLPLPEKSMKIEILGDSITSCEGTIGALSEEDWISMIFSASSGYPWIIANKLNADIRVISQSGWGVLSSWDNNPHCNIPSIYDKICGVAYGDKNQALGAQQPNDFTSWQPDFIIVNLGTNDGGAFTQPAYLDPNTNEVFQQISLSEDNFEPTCIKRFETAIEDFLYQLRSYNPNSYILWCYGMLGITMKPYILHAIQSYQLKTNDCKVEFLELVDTTKERNARFP